MASLLPQAELDAMAARMKAAARAAEADRETLSAELAALRGELAAEQEAARTQTKASRAAAAAHADEIMHCNAQAAELSTQVSRRRTRLCTATLRPRSCRPR